MLTNEQIQSLNDLETIVFSYVTKNGKDVLNMKINELAQKTHVSTTTILRFCKKAGCNGFSEFKIKYRLYLEKPKDSFYSSNLSSLIDYFYKVDKETFNERIENVSRILATKRNIILIGIGSSGILAKYGAHVFTSLKMNGSYIEDPFLMIPDIDFSDTAILALSISGNTEQVVERSKAYRERKAYIVAITNQKDCTLVKCADDCFCHYINEEHDGFLDLTTQIPTMFVIESLAKKTRYILDSQRSN